MNIDQTKKLNFMIKELTRTGAVTTFDDAVSMAGNMYEDGLPHTPTTPAVTEESGRMREMLDMRIRCHLSSITEQLNSELKKVWEAVEALKQEATAPPKPEDIDTTKEVEEEPVKKKPRVQSVDKDSHPRNGSYNSEDVSLEKFFYFGQR